MNYQKTNLQVAGQAGQRLDVFLSAAFPEYTRSFLKKVIEEGHVLLNGRAAKAGAKLKEGDSVEIGIPEAAETEILAQDIPLHIVYQDKDIAVINKPQGMVTHPAAGNYEGTLVNALMYHMEDLSGINGELRPGIVHRLDKDTSGLIVVAKNDAAHQELSRQLQAREIKKTYIALVHGNVKQDEGSVNAAIGRDRRDRKKMAVTMDGKPAVSHYKVLKRYGAYTLLEVAIPTGRTHQIRVHMKHIGHPVAGDSVYTRQKNALGAAGQLLHAQKLAFRHPATGEEMAFEAPLPVHFQNALDKLEEV